MSFQLNETSTTSTSGQEQLGLGNDTGTSSGRLDGFSVELVKDIIVGTENLRNRIEKIEKNNEKYNGFINETTKLSKTTRIISLCICIVPIVQVVLFAVIVYYLGKEDCLPGSLRFLITGISVSSIVELIWGFVKLKSSSDKIREFEEKINRIENRLS